VELEQLSLLVNSASFAGQIKKDEVKRKFQDGNDDNLAGNYPILPEVDCFRLNEDQVSKT
jgi:hypothetical protein